MRETEKIWMNGSSSTGTTPRIHVGAHGLHYGSGVFEGIRAYETPKGSAVFRLGDHLKRLDNSARLLHMELPFSIGELREAVPRADHRERPARVLPAPDRLLRLRRAGRLGDREPRRRRDHELAVGRLPR